MDTLNLVYPGCMGVYLTEAGHLVAFYRKKGALKAGLSVKQGIEASQILAEIPTWMGNLAKLTMQAVSIQEASDMFVGLKRLEKENYRKAWCNVVKQPPIIS